MRILQPPGGAAAARVPLSLTSAGKLFATGATVGPMVDSIHNRCLLQYDYAPVSVEPFLHSSWIVPPLLGVSYVVLGAVLPRAVQRIVAAASKKDNGQVLSRTRADPSFLGLRAAQAVVSTILIIVLSLYLETARTAGDGADATILGLIPSGSAANVLILSLAALGQWSWLDRSGTALISAALAAVLGPLCELPLCAHGLWHYLPQACDYFPLGALAGLLRYIGIGVGENGGGIGGGILGSGAAVLVESDVTRTLGLASITGPCYFAVTTDAIALGRWFDAQQDQQQQDQQ